MSPNIDTNDFNVKVKNAQQVPERWQPGEGLPSVSAAVRWRIRRIGEELLQKFGEPLR